MADSGLEPVMGEELTEAWDAPAKAVRGPFKGRGTPGGDDFSSSFHKDIDKRKRLSMARISFQVFCHLIHSTATRVYKGAIPTGAHSHF